MDIAALVGRIAQDPDCVVLPAAGQPVVGSAHTMPQDVQAFYSLCSGVTIGIGSFYEARIVAPEECRLANDVILGSFAAAAHEEQPEDPSWNWCIIAEVENGNYLSIDFGPEHNGRCYDSFWETHGQVGNMPVIEVSFTKLLEQLYAHMGEHWYWLEPGFVSLGDAYDAI